LELQRSENQVALLKLPELPIVQHPITDAEQNKVVICAELGELGSKHSPVDAKQIKQPKAHANATSESDIVCRNRSRRALVQLIS
jgi:hypothetical protein